MGMSKPRNGPPRHRTRASLVGLLGFALLGLGPMAQADTPGGEDPGTGDAGEAAPGEDFDAVFGGEPFYTETQLATNGDGGWPN